MSEQVFGLPTTDLPPPQAEVLALTPELYSLLVEAGSYRPRAEVESDEAWRQIIPYAVITHADSVLLVERLKAGSESRLHNLLSIGLGGHINPIDHANARDVIEGALARELSEELHIGGYIAAAVGLIHTDDDPVSRVHTGVLYNIKSAAEVSIQETPKLAGEMVTWDAVGKVYDRLEGWSQMAYQFLR